MVAVGGAASRSGRGPRPGCRSGTHGSDPAADTGPRQRRPPGGRARAAPSGPGAAGRTAGRTTSWKRIPGSRPPPRRGQPEVGEPPRLCPARRIGPSRGSTGSRHDLHRLRGPPPPGLGRPPNAVARGEATCEHQDQDEPRDPQPAAPRGFPDGVVARRWARPTPGAPAERGATASSSAHTAPRPSGVAAPRRGRRPRRRGGRAYRAPSISCPQSSHRALVPTLPPRTVYHRPHRSH